MFLANCAPSPLFPMGLLQNISQQLIIEMHKVIYFKRLNGDQPAREWIKSQDNRIRPNIYRKIEDLSDQGINLLNTNVLDIIKGPDKGLYELRNRGLGWRLAVYYHQKYDTFVILHGWRKDNSYKKEIGKARSLLHEYIKMEQEKYG